MKKFLVLILVLALFTSQAFADEAALPELPNLDTLGAGTAMPAAERYAIESAIRMQLLQLQDLIAPLPPEQVAPLLVEKLGKIQGVHFAKETDGHEVVLQLVDGTPIAIGTASESGLKSVPGTWPGPFAFPANTDAVLLDNWGMAPTVSTWLKTELTKASYAPTQSDGTIMLLRTAIRDKDITWFSTHGGILEMPLNTEPDGPKMKVYTLSTEDSSALCETAPCPDLESDIRELRVMRKINAKGAILEYRITRGFVRKYMSFRPHSIVVLDACNSMRNDPAVHDFHRELTAKGAGTIVGWSDSVHETFAVDTIPLLFDGILGTNKFHPAKPDQRPFSLPEIYDAMGAAGKLIDPAAPNARLKFIQNGTESATLNPSIAFLQVEESKHRLHLFGEFGAAPSKLDGLVSVGSEFLNWTLWTHDEIWADLPDPSSVLGGDVKVNINGHPSNTVPLTYWQGRMKLKGTNNAFYGAPGPIATLDCPNLKFRADLHRFRTQPDGKLVSGFNGDGRIDISDAMPDLACDFNEDGYGDMYSLRTVRGPSRYKIIWVHNEESPRDKPWVFFIGHFNRDAKSFAMILNYLGYAPSKSIDLTTGNVVSSDAWVPDASPRVDTLRAYPQLLDGKFGLPARQGIQQKVPYVGDAELEYEVPAFALPDDEKTAG